MIRNTMIRRIQLAPIILALGWVSGSAHAALQGRDLNGSAGSFEAYFDTDLDITWLADANYAKTSGYDADGRMDWAAANIWAASLSFTDGVNIYDNWRLPTVKPVNGASFNYSASYNGSTDYGYNISEQGTAYAGSTGSEMAHLFYNTLNNKGYCDPALSTASTCSGSQSGWGLTNTGPFTNLQAENYWSATSVPSDPIHAWDFAFRYGLQGSDRKDFGHYALAVSPGDIAAVPEAQTYALMLAGLGLIGWRARRRG